MYLNTVIPVVIVPGQDVNLRLKQRRLDQLKLLLNSVGLTIRIHEASSLIEATRIAHEASRSSRFVVACGGDGTVSAVAAGLADTGCCLGILPSGSGNDIARGLNIPRKLSDAARLLKDGAVNVLPKMPTQCPEQTAQKAYEPSPQTTDPEIRSTVTILKMDLGLLRFYDSDKPPHSVNEQQKQISHHEPLPHESQMPRDEQISGKGKFSDEGPFSHHEQVHHDKLKRRTFINTLGVGFDGLAAYNASRTKWIPGKLKYLYGVFKSLFSWRATSMQVELDHEIITERLLMTTVANGPFEGGGIPIAPPADPSDGLFDVVMIRDVHRLARIPLLLRVFFFGAVGGPKIIMRKSRTIHIHTTPPCFVHADGEMISLSLSHITASVKPGALAMTTPGDTTTARVDSTK